MIRPWGNSTPLIFSTMARKDLLHVIQSVGLSHEESALYLAGLSLGSAPASAYAKRAGMNRVTAYNHLESLAQRSLLTVMKEKNGKKYHPVPPEQLALESRKNVDTLHRVLPELRALQGAAHRSPQVKFFQGWEGVKLVYEDTLTAESEILNFANSALVRSCWQQYDDEYVCERVRRKIHLRGIAPDDAAGKLVHGHDKESLREIRLVPAKDFNFNNEINIYDQKVAIVSFGEGEEELFGIIIESADVAETQRQIFAMAWRYATVVKRHAKS